MPNPSIGPSRVVGRYSLYGEIAAGGMATVHLGRLMGQAGFSRTVAIKRLHPQFAKDPEFVAMFLDEARLAARIRHPNVVSTLDVVAEDGELFLVMEYVQGESLSRLIRGARAEPPATVSPTVIAAIMAPALHGLHAAHEATDERGEPLNMVHRDVSPQNILVGVDGVARVLDFGIAKAAGRIQITREGRIKGKLAYLAPEYLLSGSVTRKTDIYAAAVVLWEALTLRRLFEADNEAALVERIRHLTVEPPSRYAPGLPREFDAVVMRGLARDPRDRYETTREMAAALEGCRGIASATEVSAWVERTASAALAKRALLVADIESESSSAGRAVASASRVALATSRPLPHDPDGEAPTIERHEQPPEDKPPRIEALDDGPRHQTHVTMSTPPAASAVPRGSTRKRLVVGLALVSLGAVVAMAARAKHASAPVTAAEPDLAASVTGRAPGATEPGPLLPEPRSPATNATTTTTATATATGTPTPNRASPRARPAAHPTAAASTAAPSVNCDPPYTIDANGIYRVKHECIGP